MTTYEIEATARQLPALHRRFAPLFGRPEAQSQSMVYLRRLLAASACARTKSLSGHADAAALHRFLSCSPWSAQSIQREIQAIFAQRLVPSAAHWPVGTVGVLAEMGFVKKGTASCGVARQSWGRAGKTENCQVGVFLAGVTPAGSALLDAQLFLPLSWIHDLQRRDKTAVPAEVPFQTRPQLALALLRRASAPHLVSFDWVAADRRFGQDPAFLDALDESGQRYMVEVPAETSAWALAPPTFPPQRGTVRDLIRALPSTAWQCLLAPAPNQDGLSALEFARRRVVVTRQRCAASPCWLMARRSPLPVGRVEYFLANAAPDEPLQNMALVTAVNGHADECFATSQSCLGMAQYEARGWTSWHHHMSLVALARLFVLLTRQELPRLAAGVAEPIRPLGRTQPRDPKLTRGILVATS